MIERMSRSALAVAVTAAALPSFARAQASPTVERSPPSNAPPARQLLPQDVPLTQAQPGARVQGEVHPGDVTNSPAPPGTAGASVYRRPGAAARPPLASSGRPQVRSERPGAAAPAPNAGPR